MCLQDGREANFTTLPANYHVTGGYQHIVDLVDITTEMQAHTFNKTAYMIPPYNRATTYYKYVLTNSSQYI